MSQAFTQGFIIKDGQRVIDSSTGALTVQGDVNIGANALRTTSLLIHQLDSNSFELKNDLNNDYKSLLLKNLIFRTSILADVNAIPIAAKDTDDNYMTFQARDNGVGLVEVARLQGAADPYFSTGATQQNKFYNGGSIDVGGTIQHWSYCNLNSNLDVGSAADVVQLAGYDLAAGRRTFALATEEAVVTEAVGASDRTLAVRINGATYKIMLHT